jgi:CheY-like chemotaxis protein/HPt (histidine-containing phosphotransfer) domain-containing protein
VLLAANLEVESALQTIRMIRNEPHLYQVPIIICKSSHESSLRHELLDGGANQVLTNPVKQSTLFDCLIEVFYPKIGDKTLVKTGATTINQIVAEHGQKYHLLLVEDNEVNQKVATRLLEKMGVNVDVANNGLEAFDNLTTRFDYDLVLMDCQMPIMDGFVATQAIRHYELQHQTKPVPIIAMTANAMQGDRERCIEVGMNDYVTKPIDTDKLKLALKRWLPDVAVRNNEPELLAIESENSLNDSPIEMSRMRDLFDGDEEIIDELLNVFYDSLEPLKIKLTNMVEERSVNIKAVAHEIKGSSSNVGAIILSQCAEKLEASSLQQNWEELTVLTVKIQNELNRVKQFIENRK